MEKRLERSFFSRDVLQVAPELLGKILNRRFPDGRLERFVINEVEAYRGTEDRACHASRGLTGRTKVMFAQGGLLYVYFIYGMYWLLNVVTGETGEPQAVLIRGIEGYNGPGKLSRRLELDRDFYGEDLCSSARIWIEDNGVQTRFTTAPRVGVNYAGEHWKDIPWRFIMNGPEL